MSRSGAIGRFWRSSQTGGDHRVEPARAAAAAPPGPGVPVSAGHREVVVRTGAPAGASGRLVTPEALHRVLLAVVAGDVVEPARDGRRGRDALGVADPRALVAVLVGGVVVPPAQVLAV